MKSKDFKNEIDKLLSKTTFAINCDVAIHDDRDQEESLGLISAGTADIKFSYAVGQPEFKSIAFRYFFMRNLKRKLEARVASEPFSFTYVKKCNHASTVNRVSAEFDGIYLYSKQFESDLRIPENEIDRIKMLSDLVSEPVTIAKAIVEVGHKMDAIKEEAHGIDHGYVASSVGSLIKMNETISGIKLAEEILRTYDNEKMDILAFHVMDNYKSLTKTPDGISAIKNK